MTREALPLPKGERRGEEKRDERYPHAWALAFGGTDKMRPNCCTVTPGHTNALSLLAIASLFFFRY
jgi:hypothetical protein